MAKGGKQPGAGRPQGKQNQRTIELKAMIEGALSDVGGRTYLAQQAIDNPSAFMTLIGKILPKDVNVGGQQGNPLVTKIEVEIVNPQN